MFYPRSAGSLRLIQDFLGTPEDLFAAEAALPSALRDQKRAELLLYKLLNQVDSPAARMKVRAMSRRGSKQCAGWGGGASPRSEADAGN